MRETFSVKPRSFREWAIVIGLSGLLVSTLGTSAAHAVAIPITNHDFETGGAADGGSGPTTPVGWTLVAGGGFPGVFNPDGPGGSFAHDYQNPDIVDSGGTGGEIGTMDGPNALSVFDFFGGNSQRFGQALGDTLQQGTYTMTAAVGNRDIGTSSFGEYWLQLYAGGVLLAEATGTSSPDGTFTDQVLTYTASGTDPQLGQSLEIRIGDKAASPGVRQVDFDNIRLDFIPATPVPFSGPVSMLVLAVLLLAGVAWARLRRQPSAG